MVWKKDNGSDLIEKGKYSEGEKILIKLRSSFTMFSNMTTEELLQVINDAEIIKYRKDEVIFHQGDTGREVFFVINGIIDVYIGQKYEHCKLDKFHDFQLVNRIKAGQVFGEMASITTEKRSARCVCGSSEAYLLSFRIESMIEENNAVAMAKLYYNVVKILSERIRKLDKKQHY